MLAGTSQLLSDFFFASISVRKISSVLDRRQNVYINHYLIANPYDVPFVLLYENGRKVTLRANSEFTFSMPATVRELKADVMNLHTYEHRTLKVTIKLPE